VSVSVTEDAVESQPATWIPDSLMRRASADMPHPPMPTRKGRLAPMFSGARGAKGSREMIGSVGFFTMQGYRPSEARDTSFRHEFCAPSHRPEHIVQIRLVDPRTQLFQLPNRVQLMVHEKMTHVAQIREKPEERAVGDLLLVTLKEQRRTIARQHTLG